MGSGGSTQTRLPWSTSLFWLDLQENCGMLPCLSSHSVVIWFLLFTRSHTCWLQRTYCFRLVKTIHLAFRPFKSFSPCSCISSLQKNLLIMILTSGNANCRLPTDYMIGNVTNVTLSSLDSCHPNTENVWFPLSIWYIPGWPTLLIIHMSIHWTIMKYHQVPSICKLMIMII